MSDRSIHDSIPFIVTSVCIAIVLCFCLNRMAGCEERTGGPLDPIYRSQWRAKTVGERHPATAEASEAK